MTRSSRRDFLKTSLGAGVSASMLLGRGASFAGDTSKPESEIEFGLVTYQWGRDWDLPTLIENCEQCRVLGVELRTTHAHGVEPTLNDHQRAEVRKRFADSPVALVSLGSNEHYDDPDSKILNKAVEDTKAFIKLGHDVGATGVKVKPDSFHDGVPHEQTIDQIGRSLNQLGEFGADWGQQIRLEVHGQCAPLPIIAQIMKIADHPNVGVCWNSNTGDLDGDGLEANFNLIKQRLGATCHVHEPDVHQRSGRPYPYQRLFELLVGAGFVGWALLEAVGRPENRVEALSEQRKIFEEFRNNAMRGQSAARTP
jgi:sugar phosphate isomerase/epimerase